VLELQAFGLVSMHLFNKLFRGVELDFVAESFQKLDLKRLSVEITLEIEDIDLDDASAIVAEGRANADAHHTEEIALAEIDPRKIDSVLWNDFPRR
jgi:uncharacterized protein (UPF0216 family)